MKLYPYQEKPHDQCVEIIKQHGLCYLIAKMRTGKSFMSLSAMQTLGKKHVLVVTSLKAKPSIISDYEKGAFPFKFTIVNYESLHLISQEELSTVDGIIADEIHKVSKFPQPSARAKTLKSVVGSKDLIMMSGTPQAEATAQLFHEFWVSDKSPWAQYKSFYAWANSGYVFKYQMMINGFNINKYDRVNEDRIAKDIEPYLVKLSQQEAGFTCEVEEEHQKVKMSDGVYMLAKQLLKDKVANVYGKEVLADTPAKMQMKLRQIYSGTIKSDDGETVELCQNKIHHIKNNFAGKKIAIYYCFIKEGEMLRTAFPNFTEDSMEFENSTDKVFLSQIVSGREGVSLKSADALILYNLDFSAVSYFQVRARMQDKTRTTPARVCFLFSENGIEEKIYKAVSKKKNYTNKYFLKDFAVNF